MRHLQQQLVTVQRHVDYGSLLQGSYRKMAETFGKSTAKRGGVYPPGKASVDVAVALLEK